VNKNFFISIVACLLSVVSCHSSDKQLFSGDVSLDSADTMGIVVVSLKDFINPMHKECIDYCSYVCDITYTPLQTTMESVFSEINYCFCSDKYVYLCSGVMDANVFVFDKNGKFVRAIRHGNGPGELAFLKCALFSSESDELIILSDDKTLNYYTPDGVYKRTVELPWYTCLFVETNDGYIFDIQYLSIDKDADPSTHILVKTDDNFYPEWYSSTYTSFFGYSIPPLRTIYDGSISFSIPPFGDYYGVYGLQLKQRYFYDCGQYSMTYKMFKDDTVDRLIELRKKQKLCSCYSQLETDSHTFIDLGLGTAVIRCFTDKNSLNCIGSVSSDYSIPFDFPIGTYNSQFVSLVEAPEVCSFVKKVKEGKDYNKQLISPETLSKLEQVQADDNPVLIFYRMRSF